MNSKKNNRALKFHQLIDQYNKTNTKILNNLLKQFPSLELRCFKRLLEQPSCIYFNLFASFFVRVKG